MHPLVLATLHAVNAAVLAYSLATFAAYLLTTAVAFRALRRSTSYPGVAEPAGAEDAVGAPSIALLVPAYNEEATCAASVGALAALQYPDYEVLVVNDGSRDRTMERLHEALDLETAVRVRTARLPTRRVRGVYRSRRFPHVWVIDKENGGKADALNAALNFAQSDLACSVDADTLLERGALLRLARCFVDDSRTVAAGGAVRIVNDSEVRLGSVAHPVLPRRILPRLQVLEYLRAFLAGRLGWGELDCTLIISGAFGLFRTDAVLRVGGYWTDTVGEDMELVVRLHRFHLEQGIPYRIRFVPDAVVWTEAPESLRVLARQRDRWMRGHMEALSRHRRMMFDPRYGRIGTLAFPYFYFIEGWGPAMEILGYLSFLVSWLCGAISPATMVLFFLLSLVCGIVLSVAAVALHELVTRRHTSRADLWRLLGLAVLENFGYRQLMSYFRARSFVSLFRGTREWGAMERRGFTIATSGG